MISFMDMYTLQHIAKTLTNCIFALYPLRYRCSWTAGIAGVADAMANCMPFRCADCTTNANCVAANAAASCIIVAKTQALQTIRLDMDLSIMSQRKDADSNGGLKELQT